MLLAGFVLEEAVVLRGDQQGGPGGHADGLLVTQAKECKVMFHITCCV